MFYKVIIINNISFLDVLKFKILSFLYQLIFNFNPFYIILNLWIVQRNISKSLIQNFVKSKTKIKEFPKQITNKHSSKNGKSKIKILDYLAVKKNPIIKKNIF